MLSPVSPPPGFVSDDTKFAMPGRWYDGDGVRFYNGSWQTQGGWERLVTANLGGVCRSLLQWSDNAFVLNTAFGTHQTLELCQDGVIYNITPSSGFTPGAVDGTGGQGYGTGAYGVGTYGSPSTADFFPLTWSLANWGQALIANPRGQGIFIWSNNTASRAALLSGAPTVVTYTLVVPQRQVMALGCSQEIGGAFNSLCIRWSDIEDNTDWTTTAANNAGEYILEGGGRIVAGRVVGDYVFVWTDVALYLGTYIGDPGETWRFQRMGNHCGLIGPNAAVVTGQAAEWVSPDVQFWSCGLGGEPTPIDCTLRKEFADNIAASQADKIVGATVSAYREIRWFYPDARDGFENSRDITLGVGGIWWRGRLARTAFADAGRAGSPIGVTAGGAIYYHERGQSDDGSALSGFIESTDFYLDEASRNIMISSVRPNFKDQVGTLILTIFTREYPQSPERTKGPFMLTPGLSKKSLRVSGRVARIRLSWSSLPAYAREGKLEFEMDPVGGR